MLRIRDKVKIKELHIPKDKRDYLQKITTGKYLMDKTKHNLIKRITEYSPCYIYGGIPSLEVIIDVGGGATRLEYYCGKGCLDKVLNKEADEPKNKEEIPSFYGCVNVDQIPHSNPTF